MVLISGIGNWLSSLAVYLWAGFFCHSAWYFALPLFFQKFSTLGTSFSTRIGNGNVLSFQVVGQTIICDLYSLGSIWDVECKTLVLAKWRFLGTVIGTWIGAIVVPLDWDRPWQRWPIPCLSSAALAHLLVNLFCCVHLIYLIFGSQIKSFLFPRRTNKIKRY
jgi:hypothetical protein